MDACVDVDNVGFIFVVVRSTLRRLDVFATSLEKEEADHC